MGLETPVSILLGDFMNIGTHTECRQVSVLAGVAKQDIPKGTQLKVVTLEHVDLSDLPTFDLYKKGTEL